MDFVGIQNPELQYPTYDARAHTILPYAWGHEYWTPGDEEAHIQVENETVRLGITNMTRSQGNWGMSGIGQTIEFQNCLTFRVKPEFSTPVRKYPSEAFGFEITDDNKRIWILFNDKLKDAKFIKRESGDLVYAMIFLPAETGKWSVHHVNLSDIYRQMVWIPPKEQVIEREGVAYRVRTIHIKAFVAIYPGSSRHSGWGSIDYIDKCSTKDLPGGGRIFLSAGTPKRFPNMYEISICAIAVVTLTGLLYALWLDSHDSKR